jgi:nucleoside-diphosphate-sugar epimerase
LHESYPHIARQIPAFEGAMSHLILGCGYLGRVVARHWLAEGHRVIALSRSNSEPLRSLGIEPTAGDVSDPASLTLPQVDTVLYAIGLDRSAGKSMREVYLGGLTNVLDALPAPRRFIYVSSTSVYGQSSGEWVDEDSPTEPAEENGRIVLECEWLLRSRQPEAIILRFAGIYGPGRMIKRGAIEKSEPLATDPDKVINLIHVEDGARAVMAAAERGRPRAIYNVADGQAVTRREFYTELARLLRAPTPQFKSFAGERTNRRISSRRMLTELGIELRYPDFRAGLAQAIGGETTAP